MKWDETWERLEDEKRIDVSSLIEYLKGYNFLEEDNLKLIGQGVEQHFSGNYIASIHILIPQFEAAVRTLLSKKDVNLAKRVRGTGYVPMDIGQMLSLPESLQIMREDFVSYLKLKYIDLEGFNLRNEVAHGTLPLAKFSNSLSTSIIYCFLHLRLGPSLALEPVFDKNI